MSTKSLEQSIQSVLRPNESSKILNSSTFVTQRAGTMIEKPKTTLISVLSPQDYHVDAPSGHNRPLQATRLAKKQQEVKEVQNLLDRKRAEFQKRMENCAKHRDEILHKRKQFDERVIKFEKFLKENEAKRQRANTRAQTEKKIREQKVLEIQHMTYMLADLQIHLEKTRHLTRIASFVILGKYQKYDEFLQSVVVSLPAEYLDTSDPHINDILLRYKTLSETNADLATNARNNTELIEKLQLQLNDVLKKLDNESMVSNAQMRVLQQKWDAVSGQSLSLERKMEEKRTGGVSKKRMLGEAVLAIENLYSRAIMKNDKSKTEKEISKPDTNLSGSGSQLPAANSAKHEPSANQTESLIKNSEQIIFKTEESLTPIYSLNTVPVNEKLKVVQDYMTDLLHLLSKVEIVVNEKKKIGTQKKKLNK